MASMLKREKQKRKRTNATHADKPSLGKSLISALLVVTLSTMSYSPAIAVPANSSLGTQTTMAAAEGEFSAEAAEAAGAAEADTPASDDPAEAAPEQDPSEQSSDPAEEASGQAEPSQESAASSASAQSSSAAASSSSASASASSASAKAATEKAIQGTVSSVAGGRYTITVKYGDAAAIPDGSTVKITEYVKEPTDPEPSREPLETEAFVSKDYLANRTAVLGKCLGVPQDGRVFFSKFLNVSIEHNGQTVTPQAAVEVSVETTAVDIACADEVELARVVYDEAVAHNAQAVKDGYVASDGKTVKAIGASNITYDEDVSISGKPADSGIVKLRYSTKELGELAVAGVAMPVATVWQDGAVKAQVLGPRSMGVSAYDTQASGLEEGEELLGAYAFGTDPAREFGTMMWVHTVTDSGASAKGAGSLVGYALQSGAMVGNGVAFGSANSLLAFKASDGFALLRVSDAAEAGKANAANASAGNLSTIERRLPAQTGGSYVVRVSYDPDSGIPANATLQVRELSGIALQEHRAQAEEALDANMVTSVRALDIEIIDAMGKRIEPTGSVDVSITLENAVVSGEAQIVHFAGDGAEVITPQQNVKPAQAGSITSTQTLDFVAESFSVYAIAYVLKDTVLTASDGNTYKVTVVYDRFSGIPENAELVVSEVAKGDEGYNAYIAQSSEALGITPERVAMAKALDISLRNPKTGEEYEPRNDIQVSVELLGEDLKAYDAVDVVHITGNAIDDAEVMDTALNGEAIEFATDGLSVYVIAGDVVPRRTYEFFIWSDENDRWDPYLFTVASQPERETSTQTAISGEVPVVPNPKGTGDQEFAGWYEYKEGSSTEFKDEPYDFNTPVVQSEVVSLYAQFKDYARVVFHDQYNDGTRDFPIVATRRGELGGTPAKTTVKISDVTSTYSGIQEMSFYGWSRTPITTPGADKDDDGNPVVKVEPDENGCIEVSGETHLYPIFKPVTWLSYWSGPTGSGATYYPAQSYFDGVGPSALPVPTRQGYTFQGWYAGRIDSETEEVIYGNVALSTETGALINGAQDGGATVVGGTLHLSHDVTLYARWAGTESTAYKIIVWRQKTTASADTPDAYKYDFVQSVIQTTPIGSTATVGDEYKNLFAGYTCRYDADVSPVNPKGYTVLNVWYDRVDDYTPTGTGHALKFADSSGATVYKEYDSVGYKTNLLTGNEGGSFVPANPTRTNYEFTGWFADANCTTQVFFNKASYDAYTGYDQKVLYETMPDDALTLYAGWSAEWYLVQVDPNYGELGATESTWFWKTIESDLVQEYIDVVRNYVESSSGEWYYVKKDRAYYGYSGNEWDQSEVDRGASYTKEPGQATEYKTFEQAIGIYSYAGWYEVLANGTEVPYKFGQPVDHDTTIKLHWKKAGVYYVKYDAGEGTMDDGSSTAADGKAYADNAEVLIDRSAIAPAGYTFAGWRVQGDPSGAIHRLSESFLLQSDFAASISGNETVTLEAVYTKLDTASITYDFNGGTNSGTFDFGHPVDPNAPAPITDMAPDGKSATVSNLVNNSEFVLSAGTTLSRSGATFMGWSVNPVYNPETDTLFKPGTEAYGVNREEPTTLYAVWQAKVTYHLNKDDAGWGGTWPSSTYTYDADSNTYSQLVFVGNPILEPTNIPTYPSADFMFMYWVDSATGTAAYDFSQAVTGNFDLYGFWNGPITVPVHAVDASAQTIVDKTGVDGWSTEAINAGADPVKVLPSDEGGHAYATAPNDPDHPYELAFVAAHKAGEDNLQTISQDEAVTAIYYNQAAKHLYVKYADTSKPDAELDESYEIYYVYYEQQNLGIAYKNMVPSGELTPATVTGAPTGTDAKLGEYDVTTKLATPLAWASSSGYYAYAIGNADATNASGLHLITNVSNSDTARPALKVRNTWRGFQYTTDTGEGATWTDCGYSPTIYVVYFAQLPTVVMFGEQTVGTNGVMDTGFTYNVNVTDSAGTVIYDSGEASFTLKSGEAQSAVLFYSAAAAQTITITQTPNTDFTTTIESAAGTKGDNSWSYTSDGTGGTKTVTFTALPRWEK